MKFSSERSFLNFPFQKFLQFNLKTFQYNILSNKRPSLIYLNKYKKLLVWSLMWLLHFLIRFITRFSLKYSVFLSLSSFLVEFSFILDTYLTASLRASSKLFKSDDLCDAADEALKLIADDDRETTTSSSSS